MHLQSKVSLENNTLVSSFVLHGITDLGYRVDGRAFGARRPVSFEFGSKDAHCVVRLGKTVVCACIAARIEQPVGRSNEGSVRCVVKDVAMRGGKKQTGELRETLQLYERFLDRSFKESKAVDLESLCIQSGKYVWYLEVQMTVMNDDGNVLDALGYAALGALRVFKRPDVSVSKERGKALHVSSFDEKEGVPITLHHFPVAVTFVTLGGGAMQDSNGDGASGRTQVLIDPTRAEESCSSGSMTISITPQGELCAVQKAEGCGMTHSEIFACMRRGMEVAKEGCDALDSALKGHGIDRVSARIVKRGGGGTVVRAMGGGEEQIKPLPTDVQRAIDAAAEDAEMDDDDDEDLVVDDTPAGPREVNLPDEETPAEGSGRRYTDPLKKSQEGNDAFRQASEAIRKKTHHHVDSLADALR
jgi:exosome complex component RRP45